MPETPRPLAGGHRCRRAFPAAVAAALVALLAGCQRDERPAAPPAKARAAAVSATEVRVVTPQRRTVSRSIEQPGFNIEAFEETPLYPRVSGYVGKWHKDIGAPVKK